MLTIKIPTTDENTQIVTLRLAPSRKVGQSQPSMAAVSRLCCRCRRADGSGL